MNTGNKWYQIKEKSAGIKRLRLTWGIYKLLGRKPVEWIAWCVGFITFISSKGLRKYSKIYFEALYKYTNNNDYRPTLLNSLKHIQSYAISLVDKMEVYAGTSNPEFVFDNENEKECLQKDLKEKGAFFIFTHTGNVELLRAFLKENHHKKVNIFMQKTHCEKFNNFINSISDNRDVTIFPVEEIEIETAISIKSRLAQGEIVYMAGDRLSAENTNKCYAVKLLNHTVKLPLGTLKFGLLMDSPIYLIACIKQETGSFIIKSEKFIRDDKREDNLQRLKKQYGNFLEKVTLAAPYQFYNFYDFFE